MKIIDKKEIVMMNLKESYRYANYLEGLTTIAYAYLKKDDFVTTTTQKHMRSKTNSEAQDENITVQKSFDVDFTPNNVIDFIVKLIAEKESLANAIALAKCNAEINIDNAVSMNKRKQAFIHTLKNLANIKASERQIQGSDYKFNTDGNQTKYFYPIIETVAINYDRDDVKGLIKKYSKECDEVSAKLDAIEINTIVDFNPTFDINETFEDAIVAAK